MFKFPLQHHDETGQWINIGGTYKNREGTVVTFHFSTFTVFEAAVENGESDEIVPKNDEERDDPKELELDKGLSEEEVETDNSGAANESAAEQDETNKVEQKEGRYRVVRAKVF